MNSCIRLGVFIFLLVASLNAEQKGPLYRTISSYLLKYRQVIQNDDINFNNGIIQLNMNGRRTNIQSQLILGFYSVGQALQRTKITCYEIQIIIHYNLKDGQEIFARAPVDKVLDLSMGRLKSEQFLELIRF